jgi:hypothetical protein
VLLIHAVYLRPEMQEYSHTQARSRHESKVSHPAEWRFTKSNPTPRWAAPSGPPQPHAAARTRHRATLQQHIIISFSTGGFLPFRSSSLSSFAGRVRGQSLAVAGFGTASCPGPIRARVFRCAGGNDSGARWPHAGWRCLGDPRILAPRGSSCRSWPNACSRALRTLAPHFTFVLVP